MPGAGALPGPPLKVLVIDDEKNIRTTLEAFLQGLGCEVKAVGDAAAARAAVEKAPFELAFLDLRLGTANGLDLLPELLAARPALAVVVVTAYATFDTAVQAVKRGAADYLPKPFTPLQIQHVVEKLARERAQTRRLAALEARLKDEVPDAELETRSPVMRAVLDTVARAALADAPVLLRGENGTGKSVLARLVHAQSPRAAQPLVTVNCPTLSDELLSSELFGHVKGAFTGAVRDQAGRVEAAEGGTLFLDEIGEISSSLQAKLLRFLQEKEFERLGESRTRRADVRVVAATNRDLDADVKAGRFREDLLYRLNVVEVVVPALRQRHEDILPLAHRFVGFFSSRAGRKPLELSPEVERALVAYAWPGNVRELRNTLERAVILWPEPVLTMEGLPQRLRAQTQAVPTLGGDFTLEQIEREHLTQVLQRKPSLDEVAKTLGIDASTLWRKRKRYDEPG